MAKESTSDYLFVDDLYFSALFTENNEEDDQVFPISDAKYAEELQLQEVLMASMINAPPITTQASPTSNPKQIKVAKGVGESSHSEPVEVAPEAEAGQPSYCLCEICVEEKEKKEMFRNESCHHSFCTDCISKHVATKIQENIQVVSCPGFELQRRAGARRLQISDPQRKSECPICRRLFCAQCYVPWHSGVECEEFQRLNEDERGREDLMVRELARDKKWMRCPHCRFFIEKTEGCLHLTCRCGFQFCYACGATWSDNHGGCQTQ
ncbi:hypothetical protein F0562_023178 [Nyssa sinensis]|uniref:RBR-type E3 ubiquitin transferase n=1 Tax=Nyssa sinensis TaxID=561372 RepID=A0A5J5BH83_9ASTE|nr:hypothetical protein F0562_023178 [Nyssa sinensis]